MVGCTQSANGSKSNPFADAMASPQMAEAKDNIAYTSELAWEKMGYAYFAVEDKFEITKFPPMQPVIVRYGTALANNAKGVEEQLGYWDYSKKQHYNVELPDGETFVVVQKGPQFYTNQLATLVKSGLSVTLVY